METAPETFPVTDPDLDAPDGALIYLDDEDAWYERIRGAWYKVPDPEWLY